VLVTRLLISSAMECLTRKTDRAPPAPRALRATLATDGWVPTHRQARSPGPWRSAAMSPGDVSLASLRSAIHDRCLCDPTELGKLACGHTHAWRMARNHRSSP